MMYVFNPIEFRIFCCVLFFLTHNSGKSKEKIEITVMYKENNNEAK